MPALPTRSPTARVRRKNDTFTVPEGRRRRVYRPGCNVGARRRGLSTQNSCQQRGGSLRCRVQIPQGRLTVIRRCLWRRVSFSGKDACGMRHGDHKTISENSALSRGHNRTATADLPTQYVARRGLASRPGSSRRNAGRSRVFTESREMCVMLSTCGWRAAGLVAVARTAGAWR